MLLHEALNEASKGKRIKRIYNDNLCFYTRKIYFDNGTPSTLDTILINFPDDKNEIQFSQITKFSHMDVLAEDWEVVE